LPLAKNYFKDIIIVKESIMSNDFVKTLVESVEDSHKLCLHFIDICPEDIWAAKAGTWPVWQHMAHVASGTSFFIPGGELSIPAPLTPEIIQFKAVGETVPDKKVILDYLQAAHEKFLAYAASLSDADLLKPNASCQAVGLDWNFAKTFTVLSAHALYHIGHGDTLLRAKGLKGAF
jgi:hypothetical protein